MATALPAIHPPPGGGGGLRRTTLATPVSSRADIIVVHAPGTKHSHLGKKERDIEQQKQILRQQQPNLNKQLTAKYRNTYLHTLCIDMLQEGYHKSFAQLFALVKQQNVERKAAGPESAIWNNVLLENEHEKLNKLKTLLCQGEDATRKGDYTALYRCQHELAGYFQSCGDKWLADHFYSACLATCNLVEGDEGKMAAEGHCNVGLALEERGDIFGAVDNYELFYELCQGKHDWEFANNEAMISVACRLLCGIYTRLALYYESEQDVQQPLLCLKKAYDMAKEGGEQKLIGKASYRLGQEFERNKEPKTALLYLNGYLDICQSHGDNQGIGKACEAIAKSYESEGKIEECIKYLQMFVDVADKSHDDGATSRACSNLGAIFNSLGRYEQAVQYFNKAYSIARATNDAESIRSTRVFSGIASAHKMLENLTQHIEYGSAPCLQRLIDWKDVRGGDIDKDIPQA